MRADIIGGVYAIMQSVDSNLLVAMDEFVDIS